MKYRNRLLALLLVTVLIALTTCVHPRKVAKQPYATKAPYIVRLAHGTDTFCTGVVITDKVVVTAAHCVINDYFMPINIRSVDGSVQAVGQPYYALEQMDYALVRGDFQAFDKAPYIQDVAKLTDIRKNGTEFRVCGFPLGGPLYCGEFTNISLADFRWSGTGMLLPGMSGGPVLYISRGLLDVKVYLVGVNSAVGGERSFIAPIYNIDLGIPAQ